MTDSYEVRLPTEETINRFIQGMAESYGMHISNPPYPIEIVVIWATRLKQAWQSADERPENPHAGDEIDYARDELERAVRDWLESLK